MKLFTITFLITVVLSKGAIGQQLFIIYDTVNTPLIVNKINCLAKEGDVIWAGSEYGLVSLNGGVSNFYLFNNQSASFLNNIYCITIDTAGNKWIGTGGGGMGKFDGTNWTVYTSSNSPLPSNIVKAISFDSQNKMWIGTTAGMAVWDMDSSWTIYQQFSSALMSDNIECIVKSENDTMWIGTVNGGLTRAVDSALITYTIQNGGVPDNTIQDIAVGANGYRWLACAAHGLASFIFNSPPYVEFNPSNSDMPSYTVNSLAIDNSGKTLCGTFDGGLVRYLGSIYWQVFNYASVALPDSSINDIVIDSTGVIWMATTNKGVVRFNEPLLNLTVEPVYLNTATALKPFPNPSTDFINFIIESNSINNFYKIEIYNAEGKKILNNTIGPINSSACIKMDVSEFTAGIYFVKILTDTHFKSGIFVKI